MVFRKLTQLFKRDKKRSPLQLIIERDTQILVEALKRDFQMRKKPCNEGRIKLSLERSFTKENSNVRR